MPIKIRNLDDQQAKTQQENQPNYQPLPLNPIKTQTENNLDELHRQAQLAAKFGANVTITGQWVWAGFDKKPEQKILDTLKENRWIWCRNKSKWAYRGKPSTSRKSMDWNYITNKYGVENIENEEN